MKTTSLRPMKHTRLITCLSLLALVPASLAQQPRPATALPPGGLAPSTAAVSQTEKPFSLNFPGGTVQEFVDAVETSSGEPFNVIIPESATDLRIPPVRVREVTLSPLLHALSASSRERKAYVGRSNTAVAPGGQSRNYSSIEYADTGFTFAAGTAGSQVWQLNVDKVTPLPEAPPPIGPPPVARFYQLKPNLEAGLKIEDITTVAQTAWKMMKLDEKQIPELKVHEETGILIAVGSEEALSVIDSVLRELPKKQPAAPASPPMPGQPAPVPAPPASVPRVR
jgi:hypothetical protein